MLIRLLIGGVTLAATGYAVKEYCEENGCPWEDDTTPSSSCQNETEREEKASYKKALDFHKRKKELYKTSMQVYSDFLQKYDIKDNTIQTDKKLLKQKFPDSIVDDKISSYMQNIINTLNVLSHNFAVNTKRVALDENNRVLVENFEFLQNYARNIYALAHAAFFLDTFSNEAITKFTMSDSFYAKRFNREELDSILVEAMAIVTKRVSRTVDLNGSTSISPSDIPLI